MCGSRCFWSKRTKRKMHTIIIAMVPSKVQNFQGFMNSTSVLTRSPLYLPKVTYISVHYTKETKWEWRPSSEPRPLHQLLSLTTQNVNRSWHSRAGVHTVHTCDFLCCALCAYTVPAPCFVLFNPGLGNCSCLPLIRMFRHSSWPPSRSTFIKCSWQWLRKKEYLNY